MAAAFFYSSVAVPNSIVSTINGAATTATLASAPSGYPAQYPFKAVLDPGTPVEEIVYVTNITGVTVTMERGKEGTAAVTHEGTAVFQHMVTGEDLQRSRNHEDATAAHGATGAVVGTTNAQALTNKTLDGSNTVAQAAVTGLAAEQSASTAHQAATAAHGATGAVVGTTNAQTLTNKTINGASNTLTVPQSQVTGLVADQTAQNDRLTAIEGEKVSYGDQDSTLQNPSSTTYGAGSPTVGTTFVAPASGAVRIEIGGRMHVGLTANVFREILLSAEVRAGGTIGSGSVVQAASDNHTVSVGIGASTGLRGMASGTYAFRITGLTPGSTYNVRTMQRVDTAGNATFEIFSRRISVFPV